MLNKRLTGLTLILILLTGVSVSRTESEEVKDETTGENTRLAVLWTSGDPDVAHKVCLMYTHAAKQNRWFDRVRLIVWGPSARLLAADKTLQSKIQTMKSDGIEIQACIVCADMYGVTPRLREIGVEVKPMGKPLTGMIQAGWKILTF